ncbi:type II toxin-antitoxin system RelE/ParE family toxin [Labrys neptuniae]
MRQVKFTPQAERHLQDLQYYIATEAGPKTAGRYIERVIDYCLGLETFPLRGTPRNDLRPGLRILGFERRVVIAYSVEDAVVVIHGIFYGGQDFERFWLDES